MPKTNCPSCRGTGYLIESNIRRRCLCSSAVLKPSLLKRIKELRNISVFNYGLYYLHVFTPFCQNPIFINKLN